MHANALARGARPREYLLAGLIASAGFGFTIWLFYPGMTTHDALAVYDQAHAGRFGDWQPPLMGVLWVLLEKLLGYGPQALFVPTAALYWLGFLLVFIALRETGSPRAWLALPIALLPPLFNLIGTLWRDVIFSELWLVAFGLGMLAGNRAGLARVLLTIPALATFMVGYWLRPNALFAAMPLLVYLLWPRNWRWKREILAAIPLLIGLQASTYVVNYVWLKAKEDHVVFSIFVFDLAGISHFSGQNVFPIADWTPEQFETVRTICYQPSYWDAMWWPVCAFAMERINRDDPPGTKLFGSPRLRAAWLKAIIDHPAAYAQHRLAHFRSLMVGENMVLFNQNTSGQWRFLSVKSSFYSRFEFATLWLHQHTPLFRGLTWLLLSLCTGLAGLRLADGRAKAAVLTLSGSAIVYTLTYVLFGVAAEYRYVYWTALSSLVATVIVMVKWKNDRRSPQEPAP
jgi:hypothetical protein